MNFKNNQNRSILGEGRDYGMGFAFLKKTKDLYETIQPISPCKDYLNDIVFTEKTGKSMSAYGLNCSKQNIFKGKSIYLAISICNNLSDSYVRFDEDLNNFSANYNNSILFINRIEDLLKIDRSVIEKVRENIYILKASAKWIAGLYSISLYSLLLRLSQWYSGEQDVIEYIKKFNHLDADVYMASTMLPKLKKLFVTGLHEQDLSIYSGGTEVHNKGILSYSI